jgi:hypothetical protein
MKNIYLAVLFISASAMAGTVNHKPHVHGLAQVTLALEDEKSGTIDLDVPAESIYGFEHKARTKADKAAQATGLGILKAHPASIVKLPEGCEVKTEKVEMEAAGHEEPHEKAEKGEHEGEHADVNASYSVQCKESLKGKEASVGLFALFPHVKQASFQVLAPSGQAEKKVRNSHDSLVIP